MYAKFTDDSDARSSEPAASGSVKLESNTSEKLPPLTVTQTQQSPCKAYDGNCKVPTIGVGVFLVVLTAFTIANFCLIMQVITSSYSTVSFEKVLSSLSKTSKARLRGNCPLLYNNNCYFLTWRENTEYIDGENICKSNDGFPANIYGKQHFNIVKGLLKETQVGPGNFVWIGMRYNVTSGEAHFTNGSKADYELMWFRSGYPMNKRSKDRLGIRHRFDTKYDGFINGSPQMKLDGVLCEISDKII